ncbi:MAG: hypothetical protein IJH68_10935 [Thermoguttaceae bacterium]|nr:hypothetical protein [Thermoguttaceae bacterium]MBQ6620643.1 hypothetical protein [Thermoguttaceae bacterium]
MPRHALTGLLLFAALGLFALPRLWSASSLVTLKDGRVLSGAVAQIESVAFDPNAKRGRDEVPHERIVVIDDTLRQTYVGKTFVLDIQPDDIGASLEVFKFHQPTGHAHQPLASIGSFRASAVDFDEFGRRIVELGGIPVVQGITEISPRAIHAEGISEGIDMRISPHNFRRETLTRLIKRGINPQSLDDRLRIYQFYVQAELFDEAAEEMEEIINDFRDDKENSDRLAVGLRMIRQLAADRLISELEMRRLAGQHRNVRALLTAFDEQGVAFEKTQTIKRMAQDCQAEDQRCADVVSQLKELLESLENEELKEQARPIVEEIAKELNPNTLERFSEYDLSRNDPSLNSESRLALALSGWIGGNIGTDTRLEIAVSMYRVRKLIRRYLLDQTDAGRQEIWESLQTEEASTPERVARILQLMKPPLPTKAGSKETPGEYALETGSFESGRTIHYLVQLPPEYDPNRKYPLVVTLHGENTTPAQQLDWWAGMRKNDDSHARLGQAGRFGYIVLAPEWASGDERVWDYSPKQSAAVLYSLRDALQRFSIDTDRIFLSGHSAGGTGTWDLGIAHPDLWAGIIPICGEAVKYPHYLRKNAEFVPIYGVGGELDGGKLARSKTLLDEGMSRAFPFDMTFVLFKGRGNEPFSDEIIRIFQWMQLHRRNVAPNTERTVWSMRPWDNAFWNVEQLVFPSKMMILPFDWVGPISHNFYAAETQFFKTQTNVIRVKSKSATARIGLSPEYVDFNQPIEVMFNGKRITPTSGIVLPDVRVQIEDARTRRDRQHPFWAILATKK